MPAAPARYASMPRPTIEPSRRSATCRSSSRPALVEAVIGPAGGPERPDWAVESRLAASGWASMTRLALGSPEMAAGIAGTNAPAIAAGLRDLRDAIDGWILELDADGAPSTALVERFRAARDRLLPADGERG